ncbi:DUF4405 domain-containing protein [Leptospira selangorensis]|uniref:DUF4405 domain-containing protein n=1 Tax=Leptospira selangorensis TaxID=2484982 RepID=A0A5F2C6W5_9LEPT|nr:DUF4405 domain-containing protein [Leptospira selangorensis]TGM12801.1 DUF4405 domain-containing protein [Leptospira selangorensis]TGM30862.1 DUF4405 domain-containing protein [Leptospira selangorensis]
MKLKKEFVTPYLVFIFLIVGATGVLMFFHLLDDYTKVVHEFLGVSFVVFAIFHIRMNWSSIKNYAKKKQLLLPSIAILIISIAFIVGGKMHGNLEQDILEKVLRSPVSDSLKLLNGNYQQAEEILKKNNVIIDDPSKSLEEISIQNKKSPEEIVELILK